MDIPSVGEFKPDAIIENKGFVCLTSSFKEPIYVNSTDFIGLDPIQPYTNRRLRADQINNRIKSPEKYLSAFGKIPTVHPKPYGTDYTHFDGIIVPRSRRTNNNQDEGVNDLFISPASHYEIGRSILGETYQLKEEFPQFTLHYLIEPNTKTRILISDFQRPSKDFDSEHLKILETFRPSFFYAKNGEQKFFRATKLDNISDNLF